MDFTTEVAIVTGAASGIGRAVALRLARFGKLDILVAAAGIVGPNKPTWHWSEQETERVLAHGGIADR